MITFIYGSYGAGKTTAVINSIISDIQKGIHTFLLVPEQEAVQYERKTLFALPPSAQLHLEVLNFSRLYNRVCREYGGLSYKYVTKPIKSLLMWHNLRELFPLLEEYKDSQADDSSLSDMMIQMINEFKACGVSPSGLEATASKLSSDAPLAKKLRDFALIYSSFDALISENYSDSADDLSRLWKALKDHDFFNGCNVYIDSFTSFTSVEHRIIDRIFASASNVTITIPLPHPKHSDISTAGIEESLKRLKLSAKKYGDIRETILSGNARATSPMLSYLSENLWRLDIDEQDLCAQSDGSIIAEVCKTPYAEADAAANHILALLREGERCRDIAVIMRDAEKYKGIIEPAFEKSGIPFFFSEKTDICATSPIKYLLTALRIKKYNWRKNDVIAHIKTGLCNISSRSADLFEEYITTWNIQGNRFTEHDWTMNPNGFVEEMGEREENILNAANEVRRALVEPLEKFFIMLDGAENISEMCVAIYKFLVDTEIEEKLEEIARREIEFGQLKAAKETRAIYKTILDTLAEIATALPEAEATTDELISILKIVFSKIEIGTIPTSVDEVVIGSAATLRTANPKYTLVLGLCEGEFPATINDSGLLNSNDRSTLSDLGIELSGTLDLRASDELMYVHRALSSPSHKLFVFTSTAEINGKGRSPSLPFLRIQKLFCALKTPHVYDETDYSYLTPAPKNAAAHLRTIKDPSDRAALENALEEYLPQVSEISRKDSCAEDCRIPSELTLDILGKNIRFSATSFENYVKCPFNYYCSYVLGLREKKTARFQANTIGTFIHYILETLLRQAIPAEGDFDVPSDEELIARTENIVSEYISKIYPKELGESKKLEHLYKRLRTLALLMVKNIVKEFSHSKFRPAFFELRANGKDGNPSPMYFDINGSTRVSFSGIIDRVDIFKQNGDVYIRVVDYKTGTKEFSIDDIDKGINTQMLLYLFTLCRAQNTDFRNALGVAEEGNLLPAGAVYLSANIPVIEAEDYEDRDAIMNKAEKELERSGVILDDEEILYAMSEELSPEFLLGAKKNKEGILSGKALANDTAFEDIYNKLQNTIIKISNSLIDGCADASPMKINGELPCRYCNMKPVCRKIKK